MNVLHINYWDDYGGAGKAGYRLHLGLRQLGIESRMLVKRKVTTDPYVAEIMPPTTRWWQRLAEFVSDWVTERLGWQYLCYPSSFRLLRYPWVQGADVVNLHVVHTNYFSHTVLPRLSRERPVVWTLHDMWAITGHCVYSLDCTRWQTGCGKCPRLADYTALRRDTTAWLWKVKRWLYQRSRLTVVTPSRWLGDLARQSPLLAGVDVFVIPNGLDTDVFRPSDKAPVRQALGIDPESRVVMSGAANPEDSRKGGHLLLAALNRLDPTLRRQIVLLIVGRGGDAWQAKGDFKVLLVGPIENERFMAMCYAAADVFVLPTLADNLPNSLLESLACGTPCVSFAVGGVGEVVRSDETGYLARPGDADDLARGIALLLMDDSLRCRLSTQCREVAVREYALEVQAQRYRELYEQLIHRSSLTP